MKALWTKKIYFEEEKFKIRFLRTQLGLVERSIEFMKGLIPRKNDFKSI
jgi:hypothetical protein